MSSEESGIGESQKAFNTRTLCPDSSLRSRMTGKQLIPLKNATHLYQILTTPVLFYHSVRHRILPSFKNDGQVFKRNSPLPSFLSSGQIRNDDGRKNIL